MTDTPVLLVAFNRPDRLEALIERLRGVRPSRLYVAVDGPREHVATDADRVAATRAVVDTVDWTADVRTLFRTENLGCGLGVSGAISWLFENEERGIILEDDVLPDASLFPFCADLLERYETDDRVFAVSGCNFVPPEAITIPASYRFSAVPHIWGWATWRRSWSHYSYDLEGWRERLTTSALWRATHGSPAGVAYWNAVFTLMSRQAVDTWDYQFVLAAMASGGLTATSNVNLVENVGFGNDSTHTVEVPAYLRAVEPMPAPLVHPTHVRPDPGADAWTRKHVFDATPTGLLRQGSRFLRRTS
jgi:hypothetical protein